MLSFIIGTLQQGFIYAIVALGVYITFRILDFPDMSVDGTFPLGASVAALCLTKGMNPGSAWVISGILFSSMTAELLMI